MLGHDLDDAALTALGERIYRTKLRIKDNLGFSQTDVKLPRRLFETPSFFGPLDEETAYRLIRKYDDKVRAFLGEEG